MSIILSNSKKKKLAYIWSLLQQFCLISFNAGIYLCVEKFQQFGDLHTLLDALLISGVVVILWMIYISIWMQYAGDSYWCQAFNSGRRLAQHPGWASKIRFTFLKFIPPNSQFVLLSRKLRFPQGTSKDPSKVVNDVSNNHSVNSATVVGFSHFSLPCIL